MELRTAWTLFREADGRTVADRPGAEHVTPPDAKRCVRRLTIV